MKQTLLRTENNNERIDAKDCRQRLPESYRQWLEIEGDVDDLIFYQSENRISQR